MQQRCWAFSCPWRRAPAPPCRPESAATRHTLAFSTCQGRTRGVSDDHLRLSRFKLAEPPTPRDTEASNAYAVIHDSLGPVCICSLIGINSNAQRGGYAAPEPTPVLRTCPSGTTLSAHNGCPGRVSWRHAESRRQVLQEGLRRWFRAIHGKRHRLDRRRIIP